MRRIAVLALVLSFLAGMSIVGEAKSMYVIADHHTAQFDAWNIEAPGVDPPITYQATYNLSHAGDPAGVTVDNNSAILFITSEFDEGVELVDATAMTSLDWAPGASDLAGIDIDDLNDVIYTVERGTGSLYVYDWDPATKTLTLRSGYPKALPNCGAAFGLALDEIHGFLYVADVQNEVVRIYDVATLSEISNFAPSFPPVGIAIDRNRKIVYTTAPDGTCASGTPIGNTLLSKYDLNAGIGTTVDMGHGGMGIAVDEVTGYVYVTGGCSANDISVWDSNLNFIYSTGSIGNPAGIAIGNVSYNPLGLLKNDVLAGYGVSVGQEFTYQITFGNNSASAITGATIVDTLPPELDFVSETLNGTPNTGVYDPVTHTVTWDISTLPAGYTGEIALVVRVNQKATGEVVLYNYCTIESDQTPPTTVIGGDPDSPTDEPGTYIIVNQTPDTKIETHVIDSVNGTAKFTWSGSDDSTPPAQLVYKHRLLDPDSPIYDWWPEEEEWSSSTTATYPRPLDPHLPDGTYRFQVKAKDADEAVQPSPTTYKFTIGAGALQCDVELRKQGTTTPIGTVDVNDPFDIYVGDSTGEVTSVLFSSDDSQDGKPTGQWKGPYSWDSVQGDWNGNAKTMSWTFTTKGEKEVWVEVRYRYGDTSRCSAGIFAGRVPVIVIPGIMGSYLCSTGTPRLHLWNPDDILGFVQSGIGALNPFFPYLRDPEDKLYAYLVQSSYDGLLTSLQHAGYELPFYLLYPFADFRTQGFRNHIVNPLGSASPTDNLFVFPYDWRQDIRDIASNLAQAVDWIMEVTHSDQVDIVAHSMGGLVARYFINERPWSGEDGPLRDEVRKLVFFGVPSHGSPAIYVTLKAGPFDVVGPLEGDGSVTVNLGWLANNFPGSFQLLPSDEWWSICVENDLKYLFNDQFGTLLGSNEKEGPLTTRADTYSNNPDSRLTAQNSEEYVQTAHAFHEDMGAELVFDGEFYNFVGIGVFTPYQLEKTRHFDLNMYEWRVHCSDGDRRVPRYSADRVEVIAETPKRCIIYVEDASHAGELIQGTTSLTALTGILASPYSTELISRVQGHVEPKDFGEPTYASVTFDCPVAIDVLDSTGERIAWYDPSTQTGHGSQGIAYYQIDDTTIILLPRNMKVTLRLRGTDEGEANIELSLFEGGTVTDNQILERVSVGPRTIANMDYDASSLLSPVLEVDRDGDGVVDSYLTAKRGNTPLGVDVSVTLTDGRVVVTFSGVHSAGNTVCQNVESLEGVDPGLRAVTPFYWLSTSALFSGSASITIQYDEADVPTGRESDLKLYRITSKGTIEDITQKLDQAANTVTGQTDGFSYFVVGYMNASPETRILSPSTGDTITGQSCIIQWQTTDPDNPTSSLLIDLFYSTNSGSTWTSISSDEANDGVYDWNISALRGGEYWLKLVAKDSEGGTSEATVGPFTISVFEGQIIVAPNPVSGTGTAFFYTLPDGTSTAKLMIFNVAGQPVFEAPLDADSTRFPTAGTWNPVDNNETLLASGPYVYVLSADGKVIGQGKMVIQR